MVITLACGESNNPRPIPESETMPSWFAPKYYTDFNIANIDSVVVSYGSIGYSDSQNLGAKVIHDKKLDSASKLWSFELVDSICTCNVYYFNFENGTDSIFYCFKVSDGDISVLLNESKLLGPY
jgi:hypothetical protein